ncbi:MAG: ABC transporter ATP-binding protein [Campylobacteraceae bacterium]
MYTFKNIYDSLLKYKKELFFANIFAVIATLASTPIPLIIPMLVDEVLLNKPGFIAKYTDLIFGWDNMYGYIFFALSLTLVLRLVFFFFEYTQVKIFMIISKKMTLKIREEVLRHLEKVSISEYEFFGQGRAASLMITDIQTIDDFISKTVSNFIIAILQVIFVAIILFNISWQMAILVFIFNPFVIIFTSKLSKKVAKYKKEENKAYELFQESIAETLNLFVQIRASNQEKNFINRLIQNAKSLRDASITFNYKKFGAWSFSMLLMFTSSDILRAFSIFVVAYFAQMSIGQMLAIFSYLWMVARPMEQIVNMQYAYHSAKVALSRINEIFALKKEPEYLHVKNPFVNSNTNSIELKNASFSYDGKKEILKEINLKIKKGEKVAFVGASGGGKTTLAQIIVGFYPLSNGELLFDEVRVEEIGLDVVRENVFLVLQNPHLFNDTIKHNLTLGKDVGEEKIYEALKIAQLYDLIVSLPDKLNTRVGNHGMKLSGGQRQRLTIARMILQNPNIVILDESTSALDNNTETKLFNALDDFLKDKTTIIIAHRLSTIKNVDTIFLFENGKITKINSYEELLKRENVYEN